MKRKLLSLLMALALMAGLMPAALAAEGMDHFKTVNDYPAGKFTDVASDSWYAESVQKAYELDLVKGSSGSIFSPTQNLTISSTLALACRLHSIYHNGKADFVQGDPWYQVYVDYAVENGIITAGQFTDYNANATRRQFAGILVKALPAGELEAINTIEDGAIPDLAAGSANYGDIYTLYRAGVLTGSDKYGTFQPETPIDRASVATIIARMALPGQRRQITLEEKPVSVTAITLDKTTLALQQGDSGKLTASVTPANATETLTWSSSNTSVATVTADGTVTAGTPGTAVITAAASGVKATCTVTVSKRALSAQPLYEDSNVSIKFSKVQKNKYDSSEAELYLDVTNKTGSTITVQADAVSLNGYTFNDLVMSDDVSAKSTGSVKVTIRNYDATLVNLNSVQTVGGQFRIILGGVGSGSRTTYARFDATDLYTGKTDSTVPAVSGKEKLYSDSNVEFYYGKTQKYRYSDDGSQIEVYLLVRNKTGFTVKIQNDTVVIGGRSYSRTVMSDPILAHSTGYVKVTVREYSGPTPSTVTTVGGDFRVIDDLGDRGTYTITLGGGSSGSWEGGGTSTDPDPDPDPDPGSDDGERKITYTDAVNLNEYASNISKTLNNGMKVMNTFMDNRVPSYQVLCLKQTLTYAQTAARSVKSAMNLMEELPDIPLTDGSTMLDYAGELYDVLGQLDDVTITEDNVTDAYKEISTLMLRASAKAITLQKLAVDLLAVFA